MSHTAEKLKRGDFLGLVSDFRVESVNFVFDVAHCAETPKVLYARKTLCFY